MSGRIMASSKFGGKIRNAHEYQNATENVYDGWNRRQLPDDSVPE